MPSSSEKSDFIPRWAKDEEERKIMLALDDVVINSPPPAASGAEECFCDILKDSYCTVCLRARTPFDSPLTLQPGQRVLVEAVYSQEAFCHPGMAFLYVEKVYSIRVPISAIHPFPQPANKE